MLVSSYIDTTVDDRDQVSVRDLVQHMPSPGSVHAAKNHVAVEDGTKSRFLKHSAVERFDPKKVCRCTELQPLPKYLDLELAHVLRQRVQEAVEIMPFDP